MAVQTPSPRHGDGAADRSLLLRFSTTRDIRDRNRLAERYLPLARCAANRYAHGARRDRSAPTRRRR